MGVNSKDRPMKIINLAAIFLSILTLGSAGFRPHRPRTTTRSPRIETPSPISNPAIYRSVRLSDCSSGSVNIIEDSGYVYFHNYGRTKTCQLYFRSQNNKHYTFTILSYNTRCSYDENEIFSMFSGNNSFGHVLFNPCSTNHRSYVETSTPDAFVLTRLLRQGKIHFIFQTKTVETTQLIPACFTNGITLSGSSGEGHSPGYLASGSGKYGDNLDCLWRINVTPGMLIALKFESIAIENSYDCDRDFLEIYDSNDLSNLYGKYCGNRGGFEMISNSNSMVLKFHSNGNIGKNGFKFSFKETSLDPCVIGQTIRSESGTIQSPNYPGFYGNNLDCHWTIESPSNSALYLTFIIHSIEYHTSCQYDYLDVFDGPDTKSKFIVRYCGEGPWDNGSYSFAYK